MANIMKVTFLGTCSGGGPSESRNCSSLVAEVAGDSTLWMFDCAEGTTRQFSLQPGYGEERVKINRVTKLFITHMHVDHTMGIIPFLRNILFMPKHREQVENKPPKIEIYGPAGIRTFVRSILKMTLTCTGERYVVHELLSINDEITSCALEDLHTSECAGKNFQADRETGFWTNIYTESGLSVDAGPIEHRDPCIGYVIKESAPRYRKIVVLGDTYDASAIVPLCLNPSPSLVVHEATDAYISSSIDPKSNRDLEGVHSTCIERGHSTPMMAGAFAKLVGARQLVLNHIGARFPAPQDHRRSQITQRVAVMQEIERQASEAWGMGRAQVAVDFMKVEVNALEYNDGHQRREYYRGDSWSGHQGEAGYQGTEGYHRDKGGRSDYRGGSVNHRNRSGYRESDDDQMREWSSHQGGGKHGRHQEESRHYQRESGTIEYRGESYKGVGGHRREGGHRRVGGYREGGERGEGGGYGDAKRRRL